jgi:uridine kinase
MIDFFKHPLFLFGLLLRFSFIFFVTSVAVTDWFLPFMSLSISNFTFDPWTVWVNGQNDPAAFPYGYAMWFSLLPSFVLFKLLNIPLVYSYYFSLLLADVLLLLILNKLIPKRKLLLIISYWFSPVLIIASYGLGLNDLIPILFLALAILKTKEIQFFWSGVFLSLAISAKLSMIIAVPFFLIYLFNKKALHQYLPLFLISAGSSGLLLGVPFLLSDGALLMLSNNSELQKIYWLSFDIGENISVYLIPLIYIILLYSIWRIKRLNFNLFFSTTGLSFVLIVLMTPASPGWFIWIIPFLVFYQSKSDKISIFLVSLFSLIYCAHVLLLHPLYIHSDNLLLPFLINDSVKNTISLIQTFLIAFGALISLRMLRESISGDSFFRLSRKPFAIGIAGDSGSGKDTLADAISMIFGSHSVVQHSGDDYHLWDRHKPIWEVTTHLNPKSNDLELFNDDLALLSEGKNIQARHYDHQTGKLSKLIPVKSNDFIIASGLHALYLEALRDKYNLKIFLDMDEDLRKYFKLRRDVSKRGHAKEAVIESIKKRQNDSDKFIKSQAIYADLIFSLKNSSYINHDNFSDQSLNLKLEVVSKMGFNELSFHRVMAGIGGVYVDIQESENISITSLTLDGEISSNDVGLAAKLLCPNALEFLDLAPLWHDNTLGLMQLITLCHIDQVLSKRPALS